MPNEYARVSLVYGSDDRQPFVNVFWFVPQAVIAVGDGAAAATALGDAFDSTFGPLIRAWLCTEAKYIGTSVTLNIAGVVFDYSTDAGSDPGETAGDQLPDYAAVIIRKLTATAGPQGRGRWFVGCVPEVYTNTSTLTGPGVTAANLLRDQFAAPLDVGAQTWVPNLHSKKDDTLYEIIGTGVVEVLATQRRRRFRSPL